MPKRLPPFDLQLVLALDSMHTFLSIGERIACHKALRSYGKANRISMAVNKALKLIDKHKWQPPQRKYEPDRLLRYWDQDTNTWQPIEQYKAPILDDLKSIF